MNDARKLSLCVQTLRRIVKRLEAIRFHAEAQDWKMNHPLNSEILREARKAITEMQKPDNEA